MIKFTLNDLWLILDNMTRLRLAAINLLAMGALYDIRIRALHEKIGAVPGVRDRTRPLAAELAAVDAEHDAFGRCIHHLLSAYEAIEKHLPDDINAAVRDGRTKVVSGLGDVSVSYASEATAAKRRRQELEAIGPALEKLPFATFESCKGLAERYTSHGESIDDLINRRADIETDASTLQAQLRFDALALLKELRASIDLQLKAEQAAATPTLPDNIHGQIFGYANALLQLIDSDNSGTLPDEDIELVLTPSNGPTDA
ncbi:MAG: hypothetical protein AAFS10_13710 [Myxococcota bacterium]